MPTFAAKFTQLPVGHVSRSRPRLRAFYDYPAAVPVDARETSLINGGSGTLWMLDTGFGQVGQVPFK